MKTKKNFASRHDKGAISQHHNRTRRREISIKPCVTARQGAIPHHNNRTQRRENKEKLCVTIRKEQTPHNTGHDAEKT